MRRPSLFKARDVTRLAKAVLAAGLVIAHIKITQDGSIVVVPLKLGEGDSDGTLNPWDEVLTDAADKERAA